MAAGSGGGIAGGQTPPVLEVKRAIRASHGSIAGLTEPEFVRINAGGSFRLIQSAELCIGCDTVEGTNPPLIKIGGDFDNRSLYPSLFDWLGGVLILEGPGPQVFEIGGMDLGGNLEGFGTDVDAISDTRFHSNFAMGSVVVSPTSQTLFANAFPNTAGIGACDEALYVDELRFAAGAEVTLDNIRIYYKHLIDEGAALSVMGNHEFNAIAYFTPDPDDPGKHLRVHSNKNQNQHAVFLDAYDGSDSYPEIISWFRTLPLWLDLPGLRVVHACWDERLMQFLLDRYPTVNQYLDDDLLVRASRKDAEEYKAIETLLKGKEVAMPAGLTFNDKDGNPRHHVRVRWFDGEPRTYREAFFGPESARSHIPEDPIDTDYLIEYTKDGPPVFVGHYWLDDELNVLAPNVACLDYSVAARSGGRLVAYRWDGEQQLSKDKFEFVLRAAD
ncbi:MAG: hypothetical protein IIB77_05595 [Proteobacteria bacterium]|nr:hypothetical protein [Pseudomonadota bacterium]